MANKRKDSGEVDIDSDPNAFISVNPPSGIDPDPRLGTVRVPRLAFESWMKERGWTEVSGSASVEVAPTNPADDEDVTNVPPVDAPA